jgi:hypothetical protein
MFTVALNALIISYFVTLAEEVGENLRDAYTSKMKTDIDFLEAEASEIMAELSSVETSMRSSDSDPVEFTTHNAMFGGDAVLTTENLDIVKHAMIASRKADSFQKVDGLDVGSVNDQNADKNTEAWGSHDGDFISWKVFWDGRDDVTVIGAREDSCYIAFRSTTTTILDWLSNANPVTKNLYDQCDVSMGAYMGWRTIYYDEMITELDKCLNERCPGGNHADCLVIAGFSQGAAIAQVAAVELTMKQPKMTVLFGAPRSLTQGCRSNINPSRVIRFCNTISEDLLVWSSFLYDPACDVPMGLNEDFVTFGHYFLLEPNIDQSSDETHMVYYGEQQGTEEPPLQYTRKYKGLLQMSHLAVSVLSMHSIKSYGKGYDRKIFGCANNPEKCLAQGFSNYEYCTRMDQCHSLECRVSRWGAHQCFSKTTRQEIGEFCYIGDQCSTGKCQAGKCTQIEKKSNGEICTDDVQCLSGRCRLIFGRCEDLSRESQKCRVDNDCVSGLKCYKKSGHWYKNCWS